VLSNIIIVSISRENVGNLRKSLHKIEMFKALLLQLSFFHCVIHKPLSVSPQRYSTKIENGKFYAADTN
jgi:hypothetical protein